MAVNVFTNGDRYITDKVLLLELSLKTKQNAYISLEQIGLTQDTASTYKIVHDALGVGDKLVISWTGTSTTNKFGNFGKLMPAPWGTCVVEGGDVSSWKFYPYGSSNVYNGSFTNINDNGWYGWILNAGSNNYLPSDEKIKKNIETLKNSKDFIMNLNPIKFVLKDDSEEKINFGFTAQNVQKNLKNLGYINTNIVSEVDRDGETILALSYTQLIAPLIKVVQEQEEKIKELEEKIGGLL